MNKLKPKSTKTKTLIAIIAVITVVLAVANIVASNALATTGKKLQALNQKTTLLNSQNQLLEREISERSSLSYIEARAQELGFIPIAQTLDLTTPAPLAQAP